MSKKVDLKEVQRMKQLLRWCRHIEEECEWEKARDSVTGWQFCPYCATPRPLTKEHKKFDLTDLEYQLMMIIFSAGLASSRLEADEQCALMAENSIAFLSTYYDFKKPKRA